MYLLRKLQLYMYARIYVYSITLPYMTSVFMTTVFRTLQKLNWNAYSIFFVTEDALETVLEYWINSDIDVVIRLPDEQWRTDVHR